MENFINTFKPSSYARVFGRALVNECGQGSSDPMYACIADNADQGKLELSTTIDNVERSEVKWEIKEKNLFHKSGDIMASIDSVVYMPFYEIDTGNIE